jgi:prepilin-type processing-associated H-X9-DG protein
MCVELIVLLCIFGLLACLVGPGIYLARERAREIGCRNNLKVIGLALQTYHEIQEAYPAGAQSWGRFPEMQLSADLSLWPYIEPHTFLGPPYPAWWKIDPELFFPFPYVCPLQAGGAITDTFLGGMRNPPNPVFYPASFLFCKGAGDAWCTTPQEIPADERGPFDVDIWTKLSEIQDGAAHTIFVGEGATGQPWNVCASFGCTDPVLNPLTGSRFLTQQPWGIPYINTEQLWEAAGPRASQFGSTIEPLNKNPVTDTAIDGSAVLDCRSSTDGGPHRASNFRSNHAGGGNFLFGDGSVRFISERIDLKLYRGLSTIAGAESVERLD